MPSLDVKKVAFLVLPQASLLSVASTIDPLRCANRHLGHDAYQWLVISPGLTEVPLTCGLTLPCRPSLSAAAGADLLVINAGFRVDQVATAPLIQAVMQVAPSIRTIAALDSGAWIMAKARLLDGHRATTHWEDLEDFAASFPEVEVVPDRFVISGSRWTAGGAAPAFDMMTRIIRDRHGPKIALEVAGSFITRSLDPGLPQRATGDAEGNRDPRVTAAIRAMEETLETPRKLAEIAAGVGLTARRLEGLFRAGLGLSPGSFYLELRLQAARRMLADTRHPMAMIALRTGFSSAATFSRAFRQRFDESPSGFRSRCAGFSGNGILRP